MCVSLNPLKSGHSFRQVEAENKRETAECLNPLKSGHSFRQKLENTFLNNGPSLNPLKSGHSFRLCQVRLPIGTAMSQSPQIGAFLQT